MLRNRVDPMGDLHAVRQRGAWFGNKGCLHAPDGRILRGFQGKRWITCVCVFRGRRRPLVQPGRYTELFFHDEATAYAAGHRPCAQCRFVEWRGFAELWAARFGAAKADQIDAVLHDARLDGRCRKLRSVPVAQVPEGAMILQGVMPVLRAKSGWWEWAFSGYQPVSAPKSEDVPLLTPWPLAQLMAAGLPVQMAQIGAAK